MRYTSGKVGGQESLEYAKSVLNKISEIESFEIFKDEKTPYYEDFGIEKYYYNFIIRDIDKNEVWFDTNCGYRGSKPSITEQILQLFGAREDYGIYEKIKIDKKNIKLIHNINIVVGQHNKEKYNKLMILKLKVHRAKDRYNILEGLKNIGSFKIYEKKNLNFEKEFKNTYEDKSFGENKVNMIMSLSDELGDIDIDSIKKVLKAIIYKNVKRDIDLDLEIYIL